MSNSFETKVAYMFRSKGYYSVVSAGSRGVADIVAIKPNEVLFIQCKTNRGLSSNERQRLRDMAFRFGAKAIMATHKKGRIFIIEV